ncbi:MAG: carbohydrate kinase family protein, partial [Eubacterium sp.]|nr:carbohydrate kinase family protein [Eubacterium sp.]
MKKKVIAAGHICLDITPVFSDRQVSGIEDVIKPGKLVEVGAADVHTGGSVANTGLAMQFLGADVTLIGKIGRDSFGSMILNILDQYGTAYRMISSDTESTSYSIVLAVPGIDRTFIHNPGANDAFGPEDV